MLRCRMQSLRGTGLIGSIQFKSIACAMFIQQDRSLDPFQAIDRHT